MYDCIQLLFVFIAYHYLLLFINGKTYFTIEIKMLKKYIGTIHIVPIFDHNSKKKKKKGNFSILKLSTNFSCSTSSTWRFLASIATCYSMLKQKKKKIAKSYYNYLLIKLVFFETVSATKMKLTMLSHHLRSIVD